jgi:hypothetical protein
MSLIKIKTQRQASTINIQVSSIVTQTLHLTFPTFHIPFPHYLHTTSTSPLSCKKTITKTCNFITVLITRNQYIYNTTYMPKRDVWRRVPENGGRKIRPPHPSPSPSRPTPSPWRSVKHSKPVKFLK